MVFIVEKTHIFIFRVGVAAIWYRNGQCEDYIVDDGLSDLSIDIVSSLIHF